MIKQSQPKEVLAYIQLYIRNNTLLFFCYGISYSSKYVRLNFCIVGTVSFFRDGLYESTHEILFRQFFSEFPMCVYFKSFHSLSFEIATIFQTWIVIIKIQDLTEILIPKGSTVNDFELDDPIA